MFTLTGKDIGRSAGAIICCTLLVSFLVKGCAGISFRPDQAQNIVPEKSNRRLQLLDNVDKNWSHKTVTTRPAPPAGKAADHYHLNAQNIVRLLYEQGPRVISDREEMQAAKHGLAEFKADLSRFEPFVTADGNAHQYPERRDADGVTGEVVGGLEKETFKGAIFRVEGGLSGSRVEYGEFEKDQSPVEEGSGGIIRGRVEVPFVGSRKYQNRIINAAFQETNARKAMLDYLTDYRRDAYNALRYYYEALYNAGNIRCTERKIQRLEQLLEDPRLPSEERPQVEAAASSARVTLEGWRRGYRFCVMVVLQYLGIDPTEPFVLQEVAFTDTSEYYEQIKTFSGRQQLLEQAFQNNPTFKVLDDAIRNSRLQRRQAILGKYDITAYIEGTQFPYGSVSFDDRVGGWQVGMGFRVRVNDKRVLQATRQKAEAEIREFQSRIEEEKLQLRRQIAVMSNKLKRFYQARPDIREQVRTARGEYQDRLKSYLTNGPAELTIDDLLNTLNSLYRAEIQVPRNSYFANLSERELMTATGEVYKIVGLQMGTGEIQLEGISSNMEP